MNSSQAIGDEVLLKKFNQLNLIGDSKTHLEFIKKVKRISESFHAPVLIHGETGTGKENTARAIHYLSDRKDQGFFPINCGAIPDSLLESELFGHEKGAFTNAHQKQAGIIELAEGGTLFLDEVDSLSPKAQAALLRFLQSGEYRPLGSRTIKNANVRIIAASNTNLKKITKSGGFREDLLFRLNVFYIQLLPLRERGNDIFVIAKALLEKFSKTYQKQIKKLTPESQEWLKTQPWEGNIRELENILLREFLLTENPVLHFDCEKSESINISTKEPAIENDEKFQTFQYAKNKIIEKFEQDYIKSALKRAAGNVSEAARLAGKERRAFGKLIKKYDIDRSAYKISTVASQG